MFKSHTSIRSAVATTLVSALFVSLSAHAGLLGIGGSAATGAAGGVIGNAGPTNFNAAGAATSQAATQARVQNTFTPRVPAPAIAPPSTSFSGSGAGRVDVGGAAAGEARATQAAVVSTSESAGNRALQAANRIRTGGEFAMDQAASAAPRSASISADGSTSGSVQASGRKGSVNGNANADATVSGSAND